MLFTVTTLMHFSQVSHFFKSATAAIICLRKPFRPAFLGLVFLFVIWIGLSNWNLLGVINKNLSGADIILYISKLIHFLLENEKLNFQFTKLVCRSCQM